MVDHAAALQKILELTKLLNSSLDMKYILYEMMNRTLEIIERSDIAVIFLYDKERELLIHEASVGFHEMDVKLAPNESITGYTFVNKKTLHLKNHDEMVRAMGNMASETKLILEEKCTIPVSELQSSISCPLMHNDECIGVFVLDNFISKEPMNEEDVYLAELISINATIAIVNAANYEKLMTQQQDLYKYSRMIEDEKDRYAHSTFIHNKFSEMVLKGASINDIVEEVAAMLGKDVVTVDMYHNLSHGCTGRLVTMDELSELTGQFLSSVSGAGHTVHHCEGKNIWVRFNPIRVNEEVLGWVGVISDSRELSELELITIDNCSTIIALEVLKNEEMLTLEQSLKGDFLENLLQDKSLEFMEKFAERYHYDFSSTHQLIIVKADYSQISERDLKKLRYLYKEIRSVNEKSFDNSFTLQKRNYIIAIIDRAQHLSREELAQIMTDYEHKVKLVLSTMNQNCMTRAVISEVITHSRDFRDVYDKTMRIFNLDFQSDKEFEYYYLEDMEIKRFLLANEKSELKLFTDKVLGPLKEYNNASQKDLFETLHTYVKSGGNWTETKDVLHIHGNTLTYRMNRLKDILGNDINDYYARLRIQIAFEIIELHPEFGI